MFGSKDKLEDIALHLLGNIRKGCQDSKTLPWPPHMDDLDIKVDEVLPPDIVKFLTLLISGASVVRNEKAEHIILSQLAR